VGNSAITVWLRLRFDDVNADGMLILRHCSDAGGCPSLIQFGPKHRGVIKAKELDFFFDSPFDGHGIYQHLRVSPQ
jgi:hypothetical protein